jgi:hypothetical protein
LLGGRVSRFCWRFTAASKKSRLQTAQYFPIKPERIRAADACPALPPQMLFVRSRETFSTLKKPNLENQH